MKMKWLRLPTVCLTGFLLAAVVCSVCSCSSVNAHTTRYAGASVPPTQAASVRILRFQPTQPSRQLGEIVVNAPPNNMERTMQPTGEVENNIEDKLKEEAAKLGADAVIVVDARIQREGEVFDPYWYSPYEPAYGEKVVAKAIKFESLPATGR